MDSEEQNSTEMQSLFGTIRKHIKKEEFDKVVEFADKDDDAIATKVVALIQMGKFGDGAAAAGDSPALCFERAYCLYRLGQFDEAIAALEPLPRDERTLNLLAQINFKARRYTESSQLYDELVANEPSPDTEVLTNVYASRIAGGEPEKALEMHSGVSDVEGTYELLFNKSCAEIALKDYENAALSLHTAREMCIRAMSDDGSSQEEIDKECASMLLQSIYLGIMSGKTQGSIDTCKSMMRQYRSEVELMAVASNNLAVLRGDRDLPDSLRRFRTTINAAAEEKLTAYQMCEIRFNRCVLLLHMRKFDECFRALDDLDKEYGCTSRSIVIRVSAWTMQGKWAEVDRAVQEGLEALSGAPADRDRLLLVQAQTFILRGRLAEARDIIKNDMSTLALYPSVISSVYHLHDITGDSAGAEAYLSDVLSRLGAAPSDMPDSAVYTSLGHIARLFRERGMCDEAASVYQTALSTCELDSAQRLVVSAKMVEALSYTNEGALKIMQRLPEISHDGVDDILTLENAEPPRYKGKSKLLLAPSLSVSDRNNTEKRAKKHTPEQKARRKVKLREEHLQKLQAAGKYEPSRPVKPDPERWIARKDRSYGKRGRKNRGKFVGGQGSADGSQKDMQKLDAHARAQLKKEQDEQAALLAAQRKSGTIRQQPKRR